MSGPGDALESDIRGVWFFPGLNVAGVHAVVDALIVIGLRLGFRHASDLRPKARYHADLSVRATSVRHGLVVSRICDNAEAVGWKALMH
jgi:hypothetical protein